MGRRTVETEHSRRLLPQQPAATGHWALPGPMPQNWSNAARPAITAGLRSQAAVDGAVHRARDTAIELEAQRTSNFTRLVATRGCEAPCGAAAVGAAQAHDLLPLNTQSSSNTARLAATTEPEGLQTVGATAAPWASAARWPNAQAFANSG